MKSTQHNIQTSRMPWGIRKYSLYGGFFIALILGFSSSKINAQSIDWLWIEGYETSPWPINEFESLVIDASGNIYATGYLENEFYGGGDVVAYVAKFNGAGGLIWDKLFGEAGNPLTYGKSISIDDAGNIYIMGTFEGTSDFDPGSGTYDLTSAGSADLYILKLTSSGGFVWAKRIGGPLEDGTFRSCLAINPENGQLFLTGYFHGTADFDPGSGTYNLTSAGADDIFITSLDASGNFLWADRIGDSGSDVAKSIACDSNGDVVTTGKFTGAVDFNPGPGSFPLNGGGTFISKLTGDGGFTFALKLGNGTGSGNAITVDALNNIYTTGPFTGTDADFDPGPGQFELDADGTDFFISKLDDSGNFIWAVTMTGPGYAEAYSIAVDNGGNVFTTGQLASSADFDPGPGQQWIHAYDTQEMFVSKLDASGNFVFAESGRGDDWDWWDSANYIVVDNAGSAVIAGAWANIFMIGPFGLSDQPGGGGVWSYVAKFGTEAVPPLSVSITGTNVLCYGESTGSAVAQFTGGFSPYDYYWSNGQSGPEITNLEAGIYTVTVTDNYDNSATAQVVVTEPPLLEFSTPLISYVSCNSGSDGSIQVTGTGGVSPYTFEWSNDESGPSISNLEAGTYTVTITDFNDCTQSESYQVEQPDPLEISLVNLNNETCAGSNDGGITIDISGGTNPVNAVWSNGNTGTSNMNLVPGVYSVTITDNNDCTQTVAYTIQPGGFMEINLVQIHHVSCAGESDGIVSVIGSSGVPPYVYLWSNGETGSSIDSLGPGYYSVTTSDS
ncbi:MAG TPA: SBBP repeat-containing protein, partial [Saprospiraceae bacterium]